MKQLLASAIVLFSMNAFAADIPVTSCEDYSLTLNTVYSMRTYANTSVKVFEIDMIEPAGAPVGVAVAIDRGTNLADMEAFCRFVPGLTSADLSTIKSSYNQSTGILTLVIRASQMDIDNGMSVAKTLTLTIDKAAKSDAGLVTADLK